MVLGYVKENKYVCEYGKFFVVFVVVVVKRSFSCGREGFLGLRMKKMVWFKMVFRIFFFNVKDSR